METTQPNRAWIGLLILFSIAGFIEAMVFGQISAFTPLYLPRLGIAPAEVPQWTGYISSISGIPGLLFLPFWGALADRFSRKPVIVRSFVVHLMVALVCALAGNVWIFLIGRALAGLSLGNSGLMMTTLAERTPANRNGFAFAIMNSSAPVGAFVGPLFGGPIVDRWGFPMLLWIDAALMAVVIAGMSFGYRDTFRGGQTGSILGMALDSVKLIFTDRRLQILFPALFLLFAGWMLALTYVPVAINQIYIGDNPATMVGIVMGAGGFLALFLGPWLGALSDKYGHWRVLSVGGALMALMWIPLALFHTLVPFGIAYVLVNGFASGIFAISFMVLASSASPEMRGRVMSFAYLPVNIGVFIGPFIGALVTQRSVFTAFWLAAAFTLLGVGTLTIAQKRK